MLRDTKSPAQQRKSLNPDPAARCCPARLWHRAVVNRMEKIETERRSQWQFGMVQWANSCSRSLPPSEPPITSKRWLSIKDAAQALRPAGAGAGLSGKDMP